MALPAARVTDWHICPSTQPSPHIGGPIIPPCATTVFISNQPAARITDRLECACAVDMITEGSTTVTIEGKLAARMFDACVEGKIMTGESNVLIGGPAGKQPLEQIAKDYQVEQDELTTYRPKALGIVPIPFTPTKELTKTEEKILDRVTVEKGLWGLHRLNEIADEALNISAVRYPPPPVAPTHVPADRAGEWFGQDGHRDAFRHAYWNALMTKENGEDWTREFTTAHEGRPDNFAIREAMDLYNNQVGRAIAAHNPRASNEELANLIAEALDRGDLLVIDAHGNLAWSNQVSLWGHGLTPETLGTGGQPVPKGDVYPEHKY